MIRTVIVEDEVNARKALENMLGFYFDFIEIVGTAATVKEGVELIKEKKPELLLLDVQLPDGTSFDLLKMVKKQDFKLVFITAHNEYALKAIKLSALDYILKPINPGELTAAISKVQEAIEREEQINLKLDAYIENVKTTEQNKKIILNTSSSLFVVEINELIRCEASENYTRVFVKEKDSIMMAKTLKELEEILSAFGFYRTHQSHLINLNFVDAFEKNKNVVLLKTGDEIPIATRKKENFLKTLQSII